MRRVAARRGPRKIQVMHAPREASRSGLEPSGHGPALGSVPRPRRVRNASQRSFSRSKMLGAFARSPRHHATRRACASPTPTMPGRQCSPSCRRQSSRAHLGRARRRPTADRGRTRRRGAEAAAAEDFRAFYAPVRGARAAEHMWRSARRAGSIRGRCAAPTSRWSRRPQIASSHRLPAQSKRATSTPSSSHSQYARPEHGRLVERGGRARRRREPGASLGPLPRAPRFRRSTSTARRSRRRQTRRRWRSTARARSAASHDGLVRGTSSALEAAGARFKHIVLDDNWPRRWTGEAERVQLDTSA